ncbi:hypothetical protein [Nocardia fluminea]|uniref:hypothetical protein n=1 Tax=Nocardia fluminea TaxID=134984 RepID=UPI00366A0211
MNIDELTMILRGLGGQSILDDGDLFGGMREAQWAREFVVPDDVGASAGRQHDGAGGRDGDTGASVRWRLAQERYLPRVRRRVRA